MKKILILAMALMVVGCQDKGSVKDIVSDRLYYVCLDSVVYIENYTYLGKRVLTPKFNADGTISTCLDEQSLIEYMEDMEYHQC